MWRYKNMRLYSLTSQGCSNQRTTWSSWRKCRRRRNVMTTLNGLPRSWDSFIQGICARRNLISFIRLWEECTQEEARLITREEKMGAIEDQALTAHTRRNYRKKENHHHNKRKDNHHKRQKKFWRDPSNIRCYTCDENGHFTSDCPKNKDSFNEKKKINHVHTAKDNEQTNKKFRREKDDYDE